MARVNFDTFNSEMQRQESSGGNDGIGYFGLKDDGDEGIVRILHDSSDDFDIVLAHNIKIGERYRRVNCLRNPGDPVNVCPLCAADNKTSYRFFVHMIHYVKDDKGNIVAKPVVWDRAAKPMSQKLVSMIHEYGPLSQSIFKIRRNGKAGSMETTYEIMFANPNIYKPELYPMVPGAFDNYNTLGYKVLDKNAEDMQAFLTTGNFPLPNSNSANPVANAPAYTTPPTNQPPVPQESSTPYTPPAYNNPSAGYNSPSIPPVGGYTPSEGSGTARPNRYY